MFDKLRDEVEYYSKVDNHEVFLYGEDIVWWSLIHELEKIKRKLEESRE